MKHKPLISLIVLTLAVLVLFTACGKKSKKTETPFEVLTDVLDKTVASRENDSSSLWKTALTKGSVELSAAFSDSLPFSSVAIKSYYGENRNAVSLALSLPTDRTLDATLYTDNEKAVISSSALEGAYGADFGALTEWLEEMDASLQDALQMTDTTAQAVALESALLAFMQDAQALFQQYAQITATETDNGILLKITVTPENTVLFVEALYHLAENDTDLKDALDACLALVSGEEGETVTSDALFAELELESLLEELREASVALTVDMEATKERILRQVDITAAETETDQNGTSSVKDELLVLSLSLDEDGGFKLEAEADGEKASFTYDVNDTDARRKVSISVGITGITLTPISYTYNKAQNTYTVNIEIPSTLSAEISGTVTADKTRSVITVDKVSYSLYSLDGDTGDLSIFDSPSKTALPVTLKLTVKASDTVPQMPAFTDITTLSEEELEAIGTALLEDEAIAELMELIALLNEGSTESIYASIVTQ